MRKPFFCICENKDADQLRANREANQRLCFHYTVSTIPLLPKSDISSLSHLLWLYGLCRTRSETPKTGFLITRLIYVTGFQNPPSPMKKSQRYFFNHQFSDWEPANQCINGKTGCNNLVKSLIIIKTTTYNR